MDPISLEDLALLEVLKRIDQGTALEAGDTQIQQRLHDSGLVAAENDGELRLTSAGIELCKSLQHRVAADAQAEKILQKREQLSAGA
jgi:hypothetical protein